MSVGADDGQDRLARAIRAIDAVNADDPFTLSYDGREHPKELLHAELMTEWVQRLDPQADDAQLLAARAHHLRRWSSPRTDYPEGRAGYLRWRADLKKRHAAETADILASCGYDDDTIERVQHIIRKEDLRTDPRVQTHEDALCLVFLQTQVDPVAAQLGADKAVDVLRKTLVKMSDAGIAAALALPLSAGATELLTRAQVPA